MATLNKLFELLAKRPHSSSELQRELALSQPSVSRLIRQARDQTVRIGRGRSTRYASMRSSLPLYLVDEHANVAQAATVYCLGGGGYFVDVDEGPFWLRGLTGDGLFDSLPFYLHDLRPAGFLGRQAARRLGPRWQVSTDPRQWSDDHILRYLVEHGDDLPGNLLLGEASAAAFQQRDTAVIEERGHSYPRLAERALRDEIPGSSAAGEQPKFAALHADAGPVIVKFSPLGDAPTAQRWRDLLRCEFHAQGELADHGVPSAETALYDFEGRVFLESRRFDRRMTGGRIPAISLAMVDAEFAGAGFGWIRAAQQLRRDRLIDETSWRMLCWVETFGTWIGNSDMHLANVSLTSEGETFSLQPLYDMLPMAFAPRGGELPEVRLASPIQNRANRDHWDAARQAARRFWARVEEDQAVSSSFRAIARDQGKRLG